jgi:putative NADPH-quinone reductase
MTKERGLTDENPTAATAQAPHPTFLFLVAGARKAGNTEALALAAASTLPAPIEQRWLRLDDLPLPAFVDIRHSAGVYPPLQGHAAALAEATLWASDLVIVSPVYWYNLTASAKQYLDHWSGWMRVPGLDFRARMAGRRLWGVTISSDDEARDDAITAPVAGSLKLTAEYMRMDWCGLLVGHGNQPGDVASDAAAQVRAAAFFDLAAAGR